MLLSPKESLLYSTLYYFQFGWLSCQTDGCTIVWKMNKMLKIKEHFFHISLLFFSHLRTCITKRTLLLFLGGNPRRCFYLWWIFWQLQFSHLQTYLLLWYLQLVNHKSRTESCKIWDCCNSSARYTLSIEYNHVIKKNLWLKIALQICFPTYHYCIVHNLLLIINCSWILTQGSQCLMKYQFQ